MSYLCRESNNTEILISDEDGRGVVSFYITDDKTRVIITEECDNHFSAYFNKSEVLALIEALTAMKDKMI